MLKKLTKILIIWISLTIILYKSNIWYFIESFFNTPFYCRQKYYSHEETAKMSVEELVKIIDENIEIEKKNKKFNKIVILLFFIGGSIWIIYSLHHK